MMLKLIQKWQKKFLNLFKSSKNNLSEVEKIILPNIIKDDEKIVRSVYSPINYDIKKRKLQANTFKPPNGLDEISVNRLNYTTADIIKAIGKKNETPNKRDFFGLSILNAKEIINDAKCKLEYSPIHKPNINENPYHADIKIGFKVIQGVPLPAEINYKVQTMTKLARCYIDPNVSSQYWYGEELI